MWFTLIPIHSVSKSALFLLKVADINSGFACTDFQICHILHYSCELEKHSNPKHELQSIMFSNSIPSFSWIKYQCSVWFFLHFKQNPIFFRIWGNNYLIPCWICTFTHLQRNKCSVIFAVKIQNKQFHSVLFI